MTLDNSTPEDDLAFIRRITSPEVGVEWRRGFGLTYAIWGLAFTIPLLVEWGRQIGLVALPDSFWLWVSVALTIALLTATIWIARRGSPTVGVQQRALNSVFAGLGWANFAVLAALVAVTSQLHDGRILMIHGVVVFAFQGAGWYVVWALRKRTWIGLVSGSWFITAVALGLTVGSPNFTLLAALGLFFLMVVPGFVMMRRAAD